MPNRILRDGILDSEAVNALGWPAEVFYRRLMSVVDDFGRFDARPTVLRSRLYPLKVGKVREADISRWIAECEKAGLIVLYRANSKPYILFRKLGSPRAKESRHPPPPPGSEDDRPPPIPSARTCAHVRADVTGSGSGSGTSSSTGSGEEDCPEPPKPAASGPPVPARVALLFPVVGNRGTDWALTEAKLAEYRGTFPGVDVLGECRKARQWCLDNPAKRKTPRGMPAFLGRWLSKAQDQAGRVASNGPATRGEQQAAYMAKVILNAQENPGVGPENL